MDRIDGTGGFLFRPDHPLPEKKKKTNSAKKPSRGMFGKLLSKTEVSESEFSTLPGTPIESDDQLREIIDTIHSTGEQILKYPGPDTLARYRQAVGDFIRHVSSNAYQVDEQISRRDVLNQKKYSIIRIVNEKLEKLSRSVLSSQNRQMDMLGGMEEIQGLLVDLLHVS
ncbi:YaaR family protein [Salinispira pacifica]|uniref:DUF327 domain-containing protein n=1 Tax=Salinispira pacifica TaxID=1307761 RepID=V5WG05_9SPIO|nr:YaaR family protein [Salinispira pacifica]AHC14767.1 DUF327 domain-containing protein [Salinispira pacifica]